MRYQIEAGTDAAMLQLFDPTALPDDFDEKSNHPVDLVNPVKNGGV